MTQLGASDAGRFDTPCRELLRELLQEVSGIQPKPGANHVQLDRAAGVRSTQRLAVADLGNHVGAGLWPAELKPQAEYLYAEGRAEALVAAARNGGWTIRATPHLAFFTAPPRQRLYMDTEQIDLDDYIRRWSGSDAHQIGAYTATEVRRSLWPWLKERGYATERDDNVLDDFLEILGRRHAHLRPGLRLFQTWDADQLTAPSRRRELSASIRRAVNMVLEAAGDPLLPVVSIVERGRSPNGARRMAEAGSDDQTSR
jgi:hypothetical protein